MKKSEKAKPEVINDFEPVSASDIIDTANITMEQSEAMGAIFRTIARLVDDQEIKALCKHGAFQASTQDNDIDCLRERVVKGGVIAS